MGQGVVLLFLCVSSSHAFLPTARIVGRYIRRDALHKLTTDLPARFNVIGIEDLNVKGMMACRNMARLISDVGMGEFRRQLEYKAKLNGCQIIVGQVVSEFEDLLGLPACHP
jgi:IS605 OrfB family transposase